MRKIALLLSAIGCVLLLVVGCQSDGPSDPAVDLTDETEIVFKVVNGNNQTGLPGEELPDPLVAKLTYNNGSPRVDYVVNWVILEGGGSVWAPVTVTDDKGKTKNRWTLGAAEGPNVVEVRSMAPNGNKRKHGTFTAIAGTPPELELYGIAQQGGGSVVVIRDPSDGWLERGVTSFEYVRGIDFAPDGTLYGIGQSFDGPERLLITIDAQTAFGTEVGPIGDDFDARYDISVRSDGVLHALGRRLPPDMAFCMGLATVNLGTGLATEVGSTGTCSGYPTEAKPAPIGFSSTDVLYFVENTGGTLHSLNQTTGAATLIAGLTFVGFPTLTNPLLYSLDSHPVTETLYASVRNGTAFYLATVNTSSGEVSYVEPLLPNTVAIAWKAVSP